MDFLLSKGGDIFTHRLYLNNGQARFTDVSYLVPFTLPDIPAARPGRFDADSDADIIIVWQNQYCFFENFNNFENSIATISPSGEILVPDTSSFSLTLNANTGNNLTYKWLHNQQEIAGATTSSYTAHQAGDYRVIVQHDVYPADTSLICHIGQDPLAIGENSLQNLQISPNPSNGIFRISGIIDQGHDYMIEMFDNNGNCRLISQCKSYATELDASGLPCGLYLIRISNTHQSRCLKIIIL